MSLLISNIDIPSSRRYVNNNRENADGCPLPSSIILFSELSCKRVSNKSDMGYKK